MRIVITMLLLGLVALAAEPKPLTPEQKAIVLKSQLGLTKMELEGERKAAALNELAAEFQRLQERFKTMGVAHQELINTYRKLCSADGYELDPNLDWRKKTETPPPGTPGR